MNFYSLLNFNTKIQNTKIQKYKNTKYKNTKIQDSLWGKKEEYMQEGIRAEGLMRRWPSAGTRKLCMRSLLNF